MMRSGTLKTNENSQKRAGVARNRVDYCAFRPNKNIFKYEVNADARQDFCFICR